MCDIQEQIDPRRIKAILFLFLSSQGQLQEWTGQESRRKWHERLTVRGNR